MGIFNTAKALPIELAERISILIHDEEIPVGTRLNESRLAERLGVSRTPVRAALEHLVSKGILTRRRHRSVEVLVRPARQGPTLKVPVAEDALLLQIARDRRRGKLADDVSEKVLMDQYGVTRTALRQTLERLAALGVMERKLGYGWRFVDDVWDSAARQESYRFRMTIETAAIREPGYVLTSAWIAQMRERHRAFLSAPWNEAASIAFFEMNAQFHEGVCAGSGNRYFIAAIQRQNRLRRLSNYDWKHGRERVEVNCREHLEILDRLEAGDYELAAALMYRHLALASQLRSAPVPTTST